MTLSAGVGSTCENSLTRGGGRMRAPLTDFERDHFWAVLGGHAASIGFEGSAVIARSAQW